MREKRSSEGKVDRAARAPQRAEEATVSEDYRFSIPEEARRKLGIKAGDRLRVKVERGAIILESVKPREALDRLASIADRLLGGLHRVLA
jgi:AbrB family looped-hinge helix DNA binding protein